MFILIAMKKPILLFFIFLPSVINAFDMNRGYSNNFLDNYDLRWNWGNIGYELNFQDNSNIVFVDLFNVNFKHNRTRMGLEFTPIRIWDWLNNDSENITNFTFLNFGIFWNTVDVIFGNHFFNFFVGPFNRINYIHLDNNNTFHWNRIVYTAGLRFGLVVGQYDGTANNFLRLVSMNFISGEVGFRNINGSNTFFVNVSTDIVMIVVYFISLAINSNR